VEGFGLILLNIYGPSHTIFTGHPTRYVWAIYTIMKQVILHDAGWVSQGAAGGRGEEGDAWKALADVRAGQQSSGRDGAVPPVNIV